MGRYINTVLSPKLTALSESTGGETVHGRQYQEWQEGNLPANFRGQLRWEAYLQVARPYAYPYFGLSVFALIRTTILFAPSVLASAQYIRLRLSAPLPDWPMLVLELVLLGSIAMVLVQAAVRTIGSR